MATLVLPAHPSAKRAREAGRPDRPVEAMHEHPLRKAWTVHRRERLAQTVELSRIASGFSSYFLTKREG